MRFFDLRRPGQVGDGARHLEHAVVGARRPVQARHGGVQQRVAGLVRAAMQVDFRGREAAVGFALALLLALQRYCGTRGDGAGGFAWRRRRQFVRGQGADQDLQVDAVEQGAGQAVLVAHSHK